MNYISTKQLRQIFPEVRAALARGEEYILIHRSLPIARLVPLEAESKKQKAEPAKLAESRQEAEVSSHHVTSHVLHKPMTLPVPAGYSHPVAFKHLKIDLKENVNLIRPGQDIKLL